MWLLLMVGILATTPSLYDLAPIVLIIIFIVAAAGVTKGGDIFQFFGVASLLGITGGVGGGGAGKGLRTGKPSTRAARMSASYKAGAKLTAVGSKATSKAATKAAASTAAAASAGAAALKSPTVGLAVGAGATAIGVGGLVNMATSKPDQLQQAGASGRAVAGARRSANRYQAASSRAQSHDARMQTRVNAYNRASDAYRNSAGAAKIKTGLVAAGSRFRLRTAQKGVPVLRSAVPVAIGGSRFKSSEQMKNYEEKAHGKMSSKAGKVASQIASGEKARGISREINQEASRRMNSGYDVSRTPAGPWRPAGWNAAGQTVEQEGKAPKISASTAAAQRLGLGDAPTGKTQHQRNYEVYAGYGRTTKTAKNEFDKGAKSIKQIDDKDVQSRIKKAGGPEALLLPQNRGLVKELSEKNPTFKDGITRMQNARSTAEQAKQDRNLLTGGSVSESYMKVNKNGNYEYNSKFWRGFETGSTARQDKVAQARARQRQRQESAREAGAGDLWHRKWQTTPPERISSAQNDRQDREQRRQRFDNEQQRNSWVHERQGEATGTGKGGTSKPKKKPERQEEQAEDNGRSNEKERKQREAERQKEEEDRAEKAKQSGNSQ
jgi:hypothetical protein